MSKGSGDVEAKGRASKVDAGHVEIVCLDTKRMMTVQLVMPRVETPMDNYAPLKNQQR